MHPIRFILLLSTLAACASTPAPRVPPTPPLPAEPYVCRYSLNPWYVPEGALRDGHTGPVFARIAKYGSAKAGATLTLPYGDAVQGARLAFTSGWVTVQGDFLPAKPLTLRLLKPVTFTPVVTAARGAPVRWRGNVGNLLVVELDRPDELPGEPWTTPVPCPDTTLGYVPVTFPAEPADAPKPTYLRLPKGTSLALSELPGGPAIETFRDDEGDRELRVLDERDGHAKLRIHTGGGRLEAWAARTSLTAPDASNSGLLGGLGVGGLGGSGEGRGTPDYARCAADAPFLVRIQGKTKAIGTAWKNAAWVEGAHADGLVEFTLPELDWLVLEPGATLVMTEAAADECRGPPAK